MKKNFKNTSDKTIPIVVSDGIQRMNLTTRNGNTISVFYNAENDLLVVDLVDRGEQAGNELLRLTLNEKKLLSHAK